ncbi:MAG TPA: UDP-N-acetylglucosamine 1-carboxyvinyltransferase [Spirochaetota bacterium]|nr:UDP-N-acetylglucosamine 1-carboxyvinyltransferase [Spirochaetota bacterium]HOM37717.1 UDP-N-acetylglucosamine 1-carboxyvinyltransferase [Spirochaetota bacterium]HPQ49675.1 UDP-N-acetylglucosamine 1-carboxyvinyltransferase [Spirochaetota bacterium]
MDIYEIEGGFKLNGNVVISGSKNAALPIMAATILTDDKCIIENVPDLKDIKTMIELLEIIGKKVQFNNNTLIIEQTENINTRAPYEIVKTMRASIAVLGPLLAKYNKAEVSLPGGCAIGPRPVDLHIKAMKELGAIINIEKGYINAKAQKLIGTTLTLFGPAGPTVLGTENAMMAATLADGETIIEPAAMEPEVTDLGNFLIKMGAKIEGLGTSTIKVKGVKKLKGVKHSVIPDRIEAGTFITMVGACGGEVRLDNVYVAHINNIIDKAKEAGLEIETEENRVYVRKKSSLEGIEISTLPYPGFPTDMQPQFMAMLATAKGLSIITENIFEDRFIHVGELQRMGANIRVEKGTTAIIKGVNKLKGASVMASDLRAGAGLVIAGLSAEGITRVQRIYHIDRGYEKFENKITSLGGRIIRKKED